MRPNFTRGVELCSESHERCRPLQPGAQTQGALRRPAAPKTRRADSLAFAPGNSPGRPRPLPPRLRRGRRACSVAVRWRFLLRGPRGLLAQPELAVAGPASLLARGLVVVSGPPSSLSPLHPLPRGSEIAVMTATAWPRLLLLSLVLLGAAPGPRRGTAFYLPGLAPVNFCENDKKSDECKVGEASGGWGAGGRGVGARGRGRSSGWGRAA